MVVIPSELFESNQERAFRLMNASKVTVTSDDIDARQLFMEMRELSKKREFDALSEKIVV